MWARSITASSCGCRLQIFAIDHETTYYCMAVLILLFVTLSSVAVSRQKGRARVSKLFHLINLEGRHSRPANDSATIPMLAEERDFAIAKC